MPFGTGPGRIFSVASRAIFPSPILEACLTNVSRDNSNVIARRRLGLIRSLSFSGRNIDALGKVRCFRGLQRLGYDGGGLSDLSISSFPRLVCLCYGGGGLSDLSISSLSGLGHLRY